MSSSRDDFGIAIRSALLKKGARQKFSLIFLLILAIIIFLLDSYQFKFIKFSRILINDGIYRISNISTAPLKLIPIVNDKIKEITFAIEENKELKVKLNELKYKEFQVTV